MRIGRRAIRETPSHESGRPRRPGPRRSTPTDPGDRDRAPVRDHASPLDEVRMAALPTQVAPPLPRRPPGVPEPRAPDAVHSRSRPRATRPRTRALLTAYAFHLPSDRSVHLGDWARPRNHHDRFL